MRRSLGSQLSYGSPVVVFLDRGHPPFKNFYSTVFIDVLRIKFYVNSLFHPASLPVRISINKPNLIWKRLVSGDGCRRAMKWRRFGYKLVGCLGRVPLFCLALVFQSHRCKLCRIHRESCNLHRLVWPDQQRLLLLPAMWSYIMISDLKTARTLCCCRQRRSCSERPLT